MILNYSITGTFYTAEKAKELAATANAAQEQIEDDPSDRWEFKAVIVNPVKGWAKIEVYDEDGEFIAFLNTEG